MSEDKKELSEYERQMLQIEKARMLIALESYNQQRRAYRRANRSFIDKVEDFLFG